MLIMCVACELQVDGDMHWTVVGVEVGFVYPCNPPFVCDSLWMGEPLRSTGELGGDFKGATAGMDIILAPLGGSGSGGGGVL